MKKNIALLYGFSFFDQFMIVIAVWVPYLATQGIGMRQFMELQALFALVILCGEVPSGLLTDLWGRKKTLLMGSTLKAVSFSFLPLWSGYEGFLFYHLTMGIALSMISGGDVAVVTLSYGHLLWANAMLSWIPVLLVLRVAEPPKAPDMGKKRFDGLKEVLSTTLVRDAGTRLAFFNLVALGAAGLVMVWTRQKYWQDSGVPLAYFGVLHAGYNLIIGFAGRYAALASARYGRRPVLAAVGVLPIIAYFVMASFFGWVGILFGTLIQVSRGLGDVLFLDALNERISSAFRATVISLGNLGVRASFALLGPVVGYGIDAFGLPSVLSALGMLFSIVFVFLLMPLVLRPAERVRA